MKLTDRELGAILAGLCLYRLHRQTRVKEGTDNMPSPIRYIATNASKIEQLSVAELIEFCARLSAAEDN